MLGRESRRFRERASSRTAGAQVISSQFCDIRRVNPPATLKHRGGRCVRVRRAGRTRRMIEPDAGRLRPEVVLWDRRAWRCFLSERRDGRQRDSAQASAVSSRPALPPIGRRPRLRLGALRGGVPRLRAAPPRLRAAPLPGNGTVPAAGPSAGASQSFADASRSCIGDRNPDDHQLRRGVRPARRRIRLLPGRHTTHNVAEEPGSPPASTLGQALRLHLVAVSGYRTPQRLPAPASLLRRLDRRLARCGAQVRSPRPMAGAGRRGSRLGRCSQRGVCRVTWLRRDRSVRDAIPKGTGISALPQRSVLTSHEREAVAEHPRWEPRVVPMPRQPETAIVAVLQSTRSYHICAGGLSYRRASDCWSLICRCVSARAMFGTRKVR